MFYKKAILKTFAIITGKYLCWSVFLKKLQALRPTTLLNKTPTQVFYCDYCETFKNTYFEEHLRTAASESLFLEEYCHTTVAWLVTVLCFVQINWNVLLSKSNSINPLCASFTKWSNTLKQFVGKLPTNCLSVFDHFVGLAFKGLTSAGDCGFNEIFLNNFTEWHTG